MLVLSVCKCARGSHAPHLLYICVGGLRAAGTHCGERSGMLDCSCPGNPRRDCDWPRLAEQWYDVRKPGWLRNLIHLARASCRVCGYRATALVRRCYGSRWAATATRCDKGPLLE